MPVLDESAVLDGALDALQPLREQGVEVIVVDGGSADGSPERLDAWQRRRGIDRWLAVERGRALQMNAGAAAARGRWLLFLHADTRLPPGAGEWLQQLSTQSPGWGFFIVRLDGGHPLLRVVERAINGRSGLTGVGTGDQAIFVERRLFAQIGGFPQQPLMEDVALSKRLRRRYRPRIWRDPVVTSSRRWEQRGILRTVVQMWWLRWLYFCGVSPAQLVRRYYG